MLVVKKKHRSGCTRSPQYIKEHKGNGKFKPMADQRLCLNIYCIRKMSIMSPTTPPPIPPTNNPMSGPPAFWLVVEEEEDESRTHASALIGAIRPKGQGTQLPAPLAALNVLTGHAEHCSPLVSKPGAQMQELPDAAGTFETMHCNGLFTGTEAE